MDISLAKEKYVFTTKIELDDGDFLLMREPTLFETKDFGEDGNKNMLAMEKIFPNCVIESSFIKGETPATGKEIYDELKSSSSLFLQILEIWMKSVPFQSRIKKIGK